MPNPEDGVPQPDSKKSCSKRPNGEEKDVPRKRGLPGVTQPMTRHSSGESGCESGSIYFPQGPQ